MADYEMDEACNACGAPVGEPCKADCSGICCDTGETQEVRGLRSEVARLRHALDECRAGMWEANERAEQWNALWHRDVAAAIEAESIASLAMSEGLRAVEQEPVHIRRNIGGRCRSWGPRGAGWYDPPPVVRCASTFGGYVGGEPIARCTEDMWWRVCVEVCVEVHHA